MIKSVVQIFCGNFLSKLLGLIREILTAALFGTGEAIGAFRISRTATLVPVNFFTNDALNAAFIPLYKRYQTESYNKAQTFFWVMAVIFLIFAVSISAGLYGSNNFLPTIIAPGLSHSNSVIAAQMLRILAIGVPFYLLSALLMFLGMAKEDFIPMTLRPSIQNLGLITGVLIAFFLNDPVWLAWGFTCTYALFSIWIIQRFYRSRFIDIPEQWSWPLAYDTFHGFWRTLRPLLLLPIFLQGNIVVERAVASLIGVAAISGLDYAKFLTETSIFMVSIPVAFAGLAHWSNLDSSVMKRQLETTALLIVLIGVPVSAFIFSNPKMLVYVFYARGAFGNASIQATTAILEGIAIGLWAQMLGYVLIKALNARSRNRIVVLIMAIALSCNALINCQLYKYFGALTLGLGNSVYGITMLIGTLTALGLWKFLSFHLLILSLATVGYVLINRLIPETSEIWSTLGLTIGVAMLYWAIWMFLIPIWRRQVGDVTKALMERIS